MLQLKHIFIIFEKIGKTLITRTISVVYHPKYWDNVDFLTVGKLKYWKETKKVNPGKSLKLRCKKGLIKLSIKGFKLWFTIMLNNSKWDLDWVENKVYNNTFAFTDYNLKKFGRFSKIYVLDTLDLCKWILDST